MGVAGCASTVRILSDDDILRYQTERFDQAELVGKTIRLGAHRGNPVVADHPCGDVCPQYTVRIVRYEVPIENCEQAGGVIEYRMIPSIAPSVQKFCVPPVLESKSVYRK